MPVAALISLAITLIQNGPEWATFIQQTLKLLEGDKVTPEELLAMWQGAQAASAAAEAKWRAAGQPTA